MKKFIYAALAFSPVLAFAQAGGLGSINKIVTDANGILKLLIPMAFGLAILYFFWGIAKYILAAGDEDAAKEGKSIMIYGIIAIAVMTSMWGLTAWLGGLFGITPGGAAPSIDLPKVNTSL